MPLTITCAKITSPPGTLGWSQTFGFADKQYLLVGLRANGNLDSPPLAAGINSILESGDFEGSNVSTFTFLKKVVEKVSKYLDSEGHDFEIAAVMREGDVVYLAAFGGARVCVLRNGMLANLLVSQSKGGVISASGLAKNGDILLLGTESFFKTFPFGVIKASLEMKTPDLAVGFLTSKVDTHNNMNSLGAIVIKFEEAEADIANIIKNSFSKDFVARTGSVFKNILPRNILPHQAFEKASRSEPPVRNIYLRGSENEDEATSGKKTTAAVGVILLALLAVSVVFGIKQKSDKESASRIDARITEARNNLNNAQNLVISDFLGAKDLFDKSQAIVSSLKSDGIKNSSLETLSYDLGAARESIFAEYGVSPQLFLDLTLQTSGFSGDQITSSGDTLFVLDKNEKRIISVGFTDKETKIAAGPDQVSGPIQITAYESRVFVLNNSGIDEVGADAKKVIDESWQGVLIHAYAGNIYILDKNGNSIYRYQGPPAGGGGSFGTKQKWLATGVSYDFSQSKDMEIDGSVWVLSEDGNIVKFAMGSPQSFSVSGVYPEIDKPDAVFTDENQKYLYILDGDQGRIVVVEKGGKYKAQYIDGKIKEATGLVVSEKEKKIILLAGSKLFSVEIRHL